MANPVNFSNNSQYELQLYYEILEEQSERARLKVTLKMHKKSGDGYWTDLQRPWNIKINGSTKASGTTSYNFNNYWTLTLGSWTGWHNYDDGMTLALSGYMSGHSSIGSAIATYNWTLPIELGNMYIGTSGGVKHGQVYIGTSSGVKKAKAVYIGTSSGVKRSK